MDNSEGPYTVFRAIKTCFKKTFHIFSTKEASFHPEEGYVKMFIRGRPVQLFVPEAMTGGYALSKVSPAPQVR